MGNSKIQLTIHFTLAFILSLFFSSNIFSQKYISGKYTPEILDSLKQLSKNCNTEGMNALIQLSTYYRNQSNDEKYRYYIDLEIKCVEAHGSKYNILNAYWKLMQYHAQFPGMDSILIVGEKVNALIEGDTSFNARRARIMPLVLLASQYYEKMDDAETAYEYFHKAIDLSYKDQFYDIYINNVNYLSQYYVDDGEYELAIEFLNDALSKIPDPENPDNKPLYKYSNFDYIAVGVRSCNFQKSRAILKMDANDYTQKLEAYHDIQNYIETSDDGSIDILQGTELILETMEETLPLDTLLAYGNRGITLEENFDGDFPKIYQYHGKNLMRSGQLKKAKKYLEKALNIIQKDEASMYENIAYIHDALAATHLKLGNRNEVLENFEMYKIYSDSVYIRKNKTSLETVEAKYALTQKEAENQRIQQEAENLSERLNLFYIIGGLLLLLLGLAVYFYNQQRKNSKNLTRLNQTKDKIFAILGHDLKGPSLAFNSLTKKLNYLIQKNKIDKLLELGPVFEEKGETLSRTINDVLNWALTENESFLNNPQKVNIRPMIQQVVSDLDWIIKDKKINIEIEIPEDEKIVFDKNAFLIINRNLLHNAMKFSPTQSTIKIHYDFQKRNLDFLDEGIGMNRDTIEKIMSETPVQSSIGTENEKGTGIGLVTCVKLLKLNKGELSILKNNPAGTIMRLNLN